MTHSKAFSCCVKIWSDEINFSMELLDGERPDILTEKGKFFYYSNSKQSSRVAERHYATFLTREFDDWDAVTHWANQAVMSIDAFSHKNRPYKIFVAEFSIVIFDRRPGSHIDFASLPRANFPFLIEDYADSNTEDLPVVTRLG